MSEPLFRKVQHYLGKIEILKSSDTKKIFLNVFLKDDIVDTEYREFYKFFIFGYLLDEGFITKTVSADDIQIIYKIEQCDIQPSPEWDKEDEEEN